LKIKIENVIHGFTKEAKKSVVIVGGFKLSMLVRMIFLNRQSRNYVALSLAKNQYFFA